MLPALSRFILQLDLLCWFWGSVLAKVVGTLQSRRDKARINSSKTNPGKLGITQLNALCFQWQNKHYPVRQMITQRGAKTGFVVAENCSNQMKEALFWWTHGWAAELTVLSVVVAKHMRITYIIIFLQLHYPFHRSIFLLLCKVKENIIFPFSTGEKSSPGTSESFKFTSLASNQAVTHYGSFVSETSVLAMLRPQSSLRKKGALSTTRTHSTLQPPQFRSPVMCQCPRTWHTVKTAGKGMAQHLFSLHTTNHAFWGKHYASHRCCLFMKLKQYCEF